MSKKESGERRAGPTALPVVLSEGAGIALGSVFSRLIKPTASERQAQASNKRPRSFVLAQSEDVQESLEQQKKERRKIKQVKKAKHKFETNALVVPDAATGAALEKELLMTATKGAVALFNAVSKAQRIAEEQAAGQKKKKKKGPPVSKESFMDMMRAGVNSSASKKLDEDEAHGDSSDGDGNAVKAGANWLREDYLTAGSKKLKDWDKDLPSGEDGEASSSEEGDGDDGDDSADDSESGDGN